MADYVKMDFSMFFDRPRVMRAVKDGTKSALSKAGAFVRRRAQTSIRPRKAVAQPGNPPSSHTKLLRQFIFFQYDESSETVVVGPALLNKSKGPPAGKLLEFGGETTTAEGKHAIYHAFPFMNPAMKAEQANFPGAFQDCIKG